MTLTQLTFLLALAVTVGLSAFFGRRDERVAALILLLAAVLSPILIDHSFTSPEQGIVAIDAVLFVALAMIALRSTAFWPIWAAGFQLCGLAVHLAAAKLPNMVPVVYADTLAIWSYPVLAALAVGTWMEARERHA